MKFEQPKLMLKLNLQHFAGTENNDIAARSYQPEFRQMLPAVFRKLSYFGDFFAGGVEALDGVQFNKTAFTVKTSDIPVVVGAAYNKGANVAFGTGTSNSNRFGELKEVIYTDTEVPYSWEWTWHEGIDRHTVNNSLEQAMADRIELQAIAKTHTFDAKHSLFISTSAGSTETLADYTEASVTKLFEDLSAHFVNVEAVGRKVVKANTKLYNAIVADAIALDGASTAAEIGRNQVKLFFGFEVHQVPDAKFQTGEAAYAYIAGVGKAFTGINTARTIESHDFDGFAFQGAGKAGEFILDDNKKAVVKVTATP